MKIFKSAICSFAACFFVAANGGTLTWTGAEGNYRWTDGNNWKEGSSSTDFSAAQDYIFNGGDFSINVPEYSGKPILINSLKVTSDASGKVLKFVPSGSGTPRLESLSTAVFDIATGCTLENSVSALSHTNATYNGFTLTGGGTYRIAGRWESGGGRIVVNNGTLVNAYGCSLGTGLATMYVQLATDNAKLKPECESWARLVPNPSGTYPTLDLNGTNFVNVVDDVSCSFSGDIIGNESSSFYAAQPREFHLLTPPKMTGTYGVYNSRMVFGTEKNPISAPADACFDLRCNGTIVFYVNQTLAMLKGAGSGSELSIPLGTMLTLNGVAGAASSSTFNGRLADGGDFMKGGADYELTMSGDSSAYTGKVIVAEGTLSLRRMPFVRDDDVAELATPTSSVPPALPAPSAHWAFDENFNDSIGGLEMVNGGSENAQLVSVEGAYGKCLELGKNRYLKLSDISSPENLPLGKKPFTVSIRQRCNGAAEFTRSFCFGNPETERQYFASGTIGSLRFPCLYWKQLRNTTVADAAYECFPASSASTDSLGWDHIVAAFDGTNMNCYADGELYATVGATNLFLVAGVVYFGYNAYPVEAGATYWQGYIDDVMVWKDCCLDASQVRAVTRSLAKGLDDSAGQFEKAYVSVDAGATLKAYGIGNAAKGVSGAGTIWVDSDSSLRTGAFGDGFTGKIRGAGLLDCSGDSDLSKTAADDFSGMLLVGGGAVTLNSSYSNCQVRVCGGGVTGGAAPIEVMDGTTLTVSGLTPNSACVATSGTLTLPETATVALSGSRPDKDLLIAEASQLVVPADFSKWTIPSDNGRYSLKVIGNQLYLAIRRGVAVIYF